MLEIYHISMLEWWRDRIRWRSKPVPIVFATPDRAFADMRTLLDASRGTDGTAALRGQNIPLPFCSLSESGLEEYDGRRDNAGAIRAAYVNPQLTRGVTMDWPTPVNINYQLDFWCETLNQRRQFQDFVRRLFKLKVTYLEIDFASPRWAVNDTDAIPTEVKLLGRRQVALNMSTWTDASNLEPGDGNREIRASLAMTLNAWMARGYVEVPLVRSFTTEIRMLPDETLISTFALGSSNGDNCE
jgi:hypothetical protein